MRRFEYEIPFGLVARSINLPGFGSTLFPVSAFYFPQLAGKTILTVKMDGVGFTTIIQADGLFSPVPTGKHVTYNGDYGILYFPSVASGNILEILYQDKVT